MKEWSRACGFNKKMVVNAEQIDTNRPEVKHKKTNTKRRWLPFYSFIQTVRKLQETVELRNSDESPSLC